MKSDYATHAALAPQVSFVPGLRSMARQARTYPNKVRNAIHAGQIAGARWKGYRLVAPTWSLDAWATANPTRKYRKAPLVFSARFVVPGSPEAVAMMILDGYRHDREIWTSSGGCTTIGAPVWPPMIRLGDWWTLLPFDVRALAKSCMSGVGITAEFLYDVECWASVEAYRRGLTHGRLRQLPPVPRRSVDTSTWLPLPDSLREKPEPLRR